ncbi:MAG: hypothetical protein JST26_11380 [Bacteroidetes bacterium]|nr:hypothetical protein [Bacteroidota bacterium]
MEKPLKEIKMLMKISKMSLDKFELVASLPVDIAKALDLTKVQFEFNIGIGVDIIKKNISIVLTTHVFGEEEKINKLGEIVSTGIFDLENIEEIIAQNEEKIPNVLLASLVGIVIATTRGFFILKTEGTFLQGLILPAVDPMMFFKKPIEQKGIPK